MTTLDSLSQLPNSTSSDNGVAPPQSNGEDPFSNVMEYRGYRFPAYFGVISLKWIEFTPGQQLPYSVPLPNYRSTTIIPTKPEFEALVDEVLGDRCPFGPSGQDSSTLVSSIAN